MYLRFVGRFFVFCWALGLWGQHNFGGRSFVFFGWCQGSQGAKVQTMGRSNQTTTLLHYGARAHTEKRKSHSSFC